MSFLKKLAIGVMAALVGLSWSMGAAVAQPYPGPGWGPPPPPYYRPLPPPPPYYRPPPPPRYYRRPPPPPVYGGYPPAHIQWCLNRYRTYNPATNLYLGFDGRYHVCRSPFG